MSTFSVFWGEMFPGESRRRPYISHIYHLTMSPAAFIVCPFRDAAYANLTSVSRPSVRPSVCPADEHD